MAYQVNCGIGAVAAVKTFITDGFFAGSAGSDQTLASGDLTTAFVKWQNSVPARSNEVIRATLNTDHSTSDTDIMRQLTTFLRSRT